MTVIYIKYSPTWGNKYATSQNFNARDPTTCIVRGPHSKTGFISWGPSQIISQAVYKNLQIYGRHKMMLPSQYSNLHRQ